MADAPAMSNDVKIEDTGPAGKRLTITVSSDAVDEKIDDAMGTLASETSLPGFRKGRAPRALIQRRFGEAVRQETKNQLVADAYSAAIEEHELKVVGDPEPDDTLKDLELEEGKPFTFTVNLEVMPDFELPDLAGIEIKRPTFEIEDEHVQEELARYQKQLGQANRIEGNFEPGDRVVCNGSVTRKGEDEPFFSHEQVLIVYPEGDDGRGQLLGLMVDGVADALKGASVTDTITLETTAPEGHERDDIRGKDLVIELEINQAERITPATTEQVIETLQLGTEEILLEQIKLALEHRRDEEQAGAMRRQVCDHLMEAVDFELPPKLSERQVTRTLERRRLELLYEGLDAEEVEDRLAEARTESTTAVKNQLKLFFMLGRLAENLGVTVTDNEVNGRVASIATARGMRPENLMRELVESGRLGEVQIQIREHKSLDQIVKGATLKDISADEWQAMVEGAGDKAKSSTKKTTKKKTTKKKTKKTTAAKS